MRASIVPDAVWTFALVLGPRLGQRLNQDQAEVPVEVPAEDRTWEQSEGPGVMAPRLWVSPIVRSRPGSHVAPGADKHLLIYLGSASPHILLHHLLLMSSVSLPHKRWLNPEENRHTLCTKSPPTAAFYSSLHERRLLITWQQSAHWLDRESFPVLIRTLPHCVFLSMNLLMLWLRRSILHYVLYAVLWSFMMQTLFHMSCESFLHVPIIYSLPLVWYN